MAIKYKDMHSFRLIFRWKGSVWKVVWKRLIVFLILYYIINLTYKFALSNRHKRTFENIVASFAVWAEGIPLTFLLGFYTSQILRRWWDQVQSVAYPDKFLLFAASCLRGSDEETVRIRKTLSRWLNLVNALAWSTISDTVKRRFPTVEHIHKAGLMTDDEYVVFSETSAEYGKWTVPVSWIANMIAKCHEEKRYDEQTKLKLLEELYNFRKASGRLFLYDSNNLPFIYSQLTSIGVYGYFMFALVSRQETENGNETLGTKYDLVFPFYTVLEFIFYFGWLGVGEELRCPFGSDDNDFDINTLVDRNIYACNRIVAELHDQNMPSVQDVWYDAVEARLPKNPKLTVMQAVIHTMHKVPHAGAAAHAAVRGQAKRAYDVQKRVARTARKMKTRRGGKHAKRANHASDYLAGASTSTDMMNDGKEQAATDNDGNADKHGKPRRGSVDDDYKRVEDTQEQDDLNNVLVLPPPPAHV